MSPAGLLISAASAAEAATVLLFGELDAVTAPQLREELLALMESGVRHITVDLADIEFVDATGLNVLVGGLRRLRDSDGDLVLRAPSPATTKVLETTGLASFFTIQATAKRNAQGAPTR